MVITGSINVGMWAGIMLAKATTATDLEWEILNNTNIVAEISMVLVIVGGMSCLLARVVAFSFRPHTYHHERSVR